MNKIYRKQTKNTPFVNLDAENLKFEISGVSFSEDIAEFYKPILQWVDDYIPRIEGQLNCKFHFDVLNSFSHKKIFNLLITLNNFAQNGKKISVEWAHDEDDEDIMEMGEDLDELIDLPFSIKSVAI
ncbi:MAG: DUF1987 domain-containing protein [Bacteroidota bacterium]|nr:DUF1987 domain-containing protein [Bacteroidota bacterium]